MRYVTEHAYDDFAKITCLLGVGLAMWSTCVLGLHLFRPFLSSWMILSGLYWVAASDHRFYQYEISNIIALH
ncbi:hypothetical protein, partial [Escherichia coli]